jgi:hypothetical protein
MISEADCSAAATATSTAAPRKLKSIALLLSSLELTQRVIVAY